MWLWFWAIYIYIYTHTNNNIYIYLYTNNNTIIKHWFHLIVLTDIKTATQFTVLYHDFHFQWKNKQFKSCRCDIYWGQHQTNISSICTICRMRFVGQEIFGALQYFIMMLFCHTVYQEKTKVLLLWYGYFTWPWCNSDNILSTVMSYNSVGAVKNDLMSDRSLLKSSWLQT